VKAYSLDQSDQSKAIDFAVLGCDGVWENGSKCVIKFIRDLRFKGEPLQTICEKLLDKLVCPDKLSMSKLR